MLLVDDVIDFLTDDGLLIAMLEGKDTKKSDDATTPLVCVWVDAAASLSFAWH